MSDFTNDEILLLKFLLTAPEEERTRFMDSIPPHKVDEAIRLINRWLDTGILDVLGEINTIEYIDWITEDMTEFPIAESIIEKIKSNIE